MENNVYVLLKQNDNEVVVDVTNISFTELLKYKGYMLYGFCDSQGHLTFNPFTLPINPVESNIYDLTCCKCKHKYQCNSADLDTCKLRQLASLMYIHHPNLQGIVCSGELDELVDDLFCLQDTNLLFFCLHGRDALKLVGKGGVN